MEREQQQFGVDELRGDCEPGAEGARDPSNEGQASELCGSAMAMTLPVLNATALTESGGDPVVTKYYFAGGKRVAMDREGVVQWLIGDHLGTTSLVLDANGTVHSEARHYPYGEERWSSGTVPTDYRFTGQRSDGYIKLTVMGARWYDGQLGRWISPDSIIPDSANPQSFNRYSYVEGNPLRFRDPTGHWREDVHFFKTRAWAYDLALRVVEYKGVYAPAYHANNLSLEIAWADINVDVEAGKEWLKCPGRECGQTPDPDLGGAIPEQYYHYPSKADAEARLMAAIEAKDPTAFGRALHSYQDYYAHTLSGFTAKEGDIGSLFSNCPECFEEESYGVLFDRARGLGHDGISWPDEFDLTEQRAIDMMNGTKWYTLLFLLNYYDIDLEEYLSHLDTDD